MTSLNFDQLNPQAKQSLAVTLASFVLQDAKIPINADNLKKALTSSKNTVPDSFVHAFTLTFESLPLDKLLVVGGGSGGSASSTAPAKAKEEKKTEAKKEEPTVVEEPEVDMDMGDLFG